MIAVNVIRNFFRNCGSEFGSQPSLQFVQEALSGPTMFQEEELEASAFTAFA